MVALWGEREEGQLMAGDKGRGAAPSCSPPVAPGSAQRPSETAGNNNMNSPAIRKVMFLIARGLQQRLAEPPGQARAGQTELC